MRMLHPVLQPAQTESVPFKNHTRTLNRKSELVSAPTGHTSTTFIEYGLFNGLSSKTPISEAWPRLKTCTSLVFVTFRVKRTQRVQRMHRSWSSFTRAPRLNAFLRRVFW